MEKIIKIISINRLRNCIKAFLLLPLLILAVSCEKLLEVDTPPTSPLRTQVFSDDAMAEAAVRGIYSHFMGSNSCNGYRISRWGGFSADELTYFGTNVNIVQFEENSLLADNSYISQLWTYAYTIIYRANAVIKGVAASNDISADANTQFTGEALFLRAFVHFYLVNLFGDIPLVTETDYLVNTKITRTPVATVYQQIEADLQEAVELLQDDYPSAGRYRANKAVALALLARVYLYQEKWADAESTATTVLDNTAYMLVDFSQITLPGNNEAIWQMSNYNERPYTHEGSYLYGNLYSNTNAKNALRDDFVGTDLLPGVFEEGDARKTAWVYLDRYYKAYMVPYKYRSYTSLATTNPDDSREENSTVLRLAEQYLIRAEARAQQGKLDLAIADLDVIRARAELPLIADTNSGISQSDLLDAIMQERRVELFTEWGHRWFDLKRTGKAVTVLGTIKTGFTANDLLYPIPESELNKNPFLEQNTGY